MTCYVIVMYFMGNLLHRRFRMKRKEAMLMMTPAGDIIPQVCNRLVICRFCDASFL